MTEVYQVGETTRITATITNASGTAVDPSTTVISIVKPDGTLVVTAAAMTKSIVGTYYYDYLIGTDMGTYKFEIKATGSTSRVTKQPGSFVVEASLT